MTARPLITVVTPTYNRREALMRAIDSVRGQTLNAYEHIVADDGSTDGTRDAVAAIGDPRIRYIGGESRRGANAARNSAIAAARAPLVAFLDSDDVFLPHRLESMTALFATDAGLDLAISSFDTAKGDAVHPSRNPGGFIDGALLERALASHAIFIAGSAITMRLAAVRAVGGFAEEVSRMQDREFLLRMAGRGGALLVATPDWTKHESADSISVRPEGYIAALAALLKRHPHLRERYPDLAAYLAARPVLASLMQGRFGRAGAEYRAIRQEDTLRLAPWHLATGYLAGKRQRRLIAGEIRAASARQSGVTPDRE